jgi:hypothetical protein
MDIATLAVKLIADSTQFVKGMDQSREKAATWAKDVSKTMKDVGGDMMDFGKKSTAYITAPIVGAGVAAINMASDLEETKNKVAVVYGDMTASVMAWSQTSATAMGQSQQQALDAAGSYGNLFLTMGLGQKPAADMSMNLVQLASDLASFNNANPQDVLEALQSGLIGQSEPMRKFGVNLSESAVALQAMKMGLANVTVDMTKVNGLTIDLEQAQNDAAAATKKFGESSIEAREATQKVAEIQQKLDDAMAGSTDQVSEAAKLQARYALIMQQTTTAQGDFARTSDGLANSQRIVVAQVKDAAAALGQQLLPYALQFVNWAKEMVARFQALNPQQQRMILIVLGIAAAIGPVVTIIGGLVSAIGAVIGVLGAVTTPVLIVIAVIAALAAIGYVLYLAWTNNWGGIQQKTQMAINFIRLAIAMGMQFIHNLTSGKLGALSTLWNNAMNSLMVIINTFITNAKLLIQAFQAAFNGDWRRFGEILRQMWDNTWKMMVTILKNSWSSFKTAISALVKNIITFFKTTDWGQVGKNILEGIVNGVQNYTSWAINNLTTAWSAIVEAVKGFFQINSPSHLMRVEIGWALGEGTVLGWQESIQKLFPPTMGLLEPAFVSPVRAMSGSSISSVNTRTRGSSLTDDRAIALLEEISEKDTIDYEKLARVLRDIMLLRDKKK